MVIKHIKVGQIKAIGQTMVIGHIKVIEHIELVKSYIKVRQPPIELRLIELIKLIMSLEVNGQPIFRQGSTQLVLELVQQACIL
jgi:hypothetical protein